jgi:uncharacterized membrane protein YhaH (DUF805 family)/glutaredoxin
VESKVQLVFSGELTSAVSPEEAKQNLGKLLKLEPPQVEALLSGRRTVLKKNLPFQEAARYIAHLAKLGIHVSPEPQDAPVPAKPVASMATAMPTPPKPVASPAGLPPAAASETPPPAPGAEEITCPKCGERQPKRTLCRACSTDMPRFLAAQEELKREKRQEILASTSKGGDNGTFNDESGDTPALIGWGAEGRIGRLSYLMGNGLLTIFLVWGLVIALKLSSWLLLPILVLPFLVLSMRLGVLRCHDLGWSGWLMLINVIPYVGSLFGLLLLILPGNKNNDYGFAPRAASGLATAGALIGAVISFAIAFNIAGNEFMALAERGENGDASTSSAQEAPRGYSGNNVVTMYSLTTCGYCTQKRKELKAEGIAFQEIFLDEDDAAGVALMRKLADQGYRDNGIGTPTLEVNGVLLPNNPDMSEIRRHLR